MAKNSNRARSCPTHRVSVGAAPGAARLLVEVTKDAVRLHDPAQRRQGSSHADGWFRTGDMVTIDREGYVQITDRKKDLIKRKGEWISSVDMENAVLANPGVAEAAVIGRHDEICDEVPVVLVVRRDPSQLPVQAQDVIDVLSTTFRKWQLPSLEDIHFVESLPKTSVGKLDKKVMRKMLPDL